MQFLKTDHKLPKCSDYFLLTGLCGFVVFCTSICALAYVVPLLEEPTFAVYTQFSQEGDNFTRQCNMGSLGHIKLIIQAVAAVAGVIICYCTSDIPSPFKEGVWM